MAFKKQGSDKNSQINIIETTSMPKRLQANEEKIICKHCKKVIGQRIGNLYQVLDKTLISINGIQCPKCGKDI